MQIPLFDARVLAPLVGYLDHNGASSEAFLDRARIPGELIATGGWVAKRQVYDFALDIVERCGRPDAVFAAYTDFRLEHLGPIADAIRSCKTVKESLDVAARLGRIAYEGSEYYLQRDGDTTWFCYREPTAGAAGQEFVIDMTLAVYRHLICITADADWSPGSMLTQGTALSRHRSVDHFEGCRARYHPDVSALAFPTEFLSRRVPWQQPPVEFDEPTAWEFGPEGSAPIVEALYRLLDSQFSHRKLPTLHRVSLMVGVSSATLKRQLKSAGMTYRALCDRLRYDAACEMLAIPQMTEREIACELGYSGTSNFVRSFRRMTGLTPGEFRTQRSR